MFRAVFNRSKRKTFATDTILLLLYLERYNFPRNLPWGHKEKEGRYRSTVSLTSAIGVGGQLYAALLPGMTRYPVHRRLGGPQGWSGRVRWRENHQQGVEPRTARPVASRDTDRAISELVW